MDLTADVVLIVRDSYSEAVLLARRSIDSDAFPGCLALPGGFQEDGEEAMETAYREFEEEAGVDLRALGVPLVQIGYFDKRGRDPRGRVASVAHLAVMNYRPVIKAGDDVDEVAWYETDGLSNGLAFDHDEILKLALTVAATMDQLPDVEPGDDSLVPWPVRGGA
jgi:8-oxo-dGTP diphosphatase